MTLSSIRLSDIFTTGEIFFKLAGVMTVAEKEVNIVFQLMDTLVWLGSRNLATLEFGSRNKLVRFVRTFYFSLFSKIPRRGSINKKF